MGSLARTLPPASTDHLGPRSRRIGDRKANRRAPGPAMPVFCDGGRPRGRSPRRPRKPEDAWPRIKERAALLRRPQLSRVSWPKRAATPGRHRERAQRTPQDPDGHWGRCPRSRPRPQRRRAIARQLDLTCCRSRQAPQQPARLRSRRRACLLPWAIVASPFDAKDRERHLREPPTLA